MEGFWARNDQHTTYRRGCICQMSRWPFDRRARTNLSSGRPSLVYLVRLLSLSSAFAGDVKDTLLTQVDEIK